MINHMIQNKISELLLMYVKLIQGIPAVKKPNNTKFLIFCWFLLLFLLFKVIGGKQIYIKFSLPLSLSTISLFKLRDEILPRNHDVTSTGKLNLVFNELTCQKLDYLILTQL